MVMPGEEYVAQATQNKIRKIRIEAPPERVWTAICDEQRDGSKASIRRMPERPATRFVQLEPTSFEDITTYNNFYEFGTDKADPARNAHTLKTRPWTVSVEGEVLPASRIDGCTSPLDVTVFAFDYLVNALGWSITSVGRSWGMWSSVGTG